MWIGKSSVYIVFSTVCNFRHLLRVLEWNPSPPNGQGRTWSFPGGSDSKESACNAEDPGSIPESGRPPRERNGYPLSILARIIPWTEEPGRLQSMVLQRVERDWVTNTFTFICCVRWAAKWSFPLLILWNGQIHFKRIWSLPGNFLFSQAEHKMKSERNVYKDY